MGNWLSQTAAKLRFFWRYFSWKFAYNSYDDPSYLPISEDLLIHRRFIEKRQGKSVGAESGKVRESSTKLGSGR